MKKESHKTLINIEKEESMITNKKISNPILEEDKTSNSVFENNSISFEDIDDDFLYSLDDDYDKSNFGENDDGYCYYPTIVKNNSLITLNPQLITNFKLEVEQLSKDFIKAICITATGKHKFQSKISDLLSVKEIQKVLGGMFLGKSTLIPEFWNWIIQTTPKEKYVDLIDHYGIIKNNYYDPHSNVITELNNIRITPLDTIKNLTEEQEEWLKKNILYLRKDPNQSLLGICWALGRFHKSEGGYPILEVAGSTSIGKTEYIDFISRILFGTQDNIKPLSTISTHQIKIFASCTNITPFVIDEVKKIAEDKYKFNTVIYPILRSTYDGKVVCKGNTSNKPEEFKLMTPIIIAGETKIGDTSIRNRMISVDLTQYNKADEDIFFELKENQYLEILGKKALLRRLEGSKFSITRKEVRSQLPDVRDDRQLDNSGCILLGLKALEEIIPLDHNIKNEFLVFLNKKMSGVSNPIDNFFKLLQLTLESYSAIDTLAFFNRSADKKKLHVRFNFLYKAMAEQKRISSSTLELLDQRTLLKQLTDNKIFSETTKRARFRKELTSDTINDTTNNSKDYLLKLNNATESYTAHEVIAIERFEELFSKLGIFQTQPDTKSKKSNKENKVLKIS